MPMVAHEIMKIDVIYDNNMYTYAVIDICTPTTLTLYIDWPKLEKCHVHSSVY